MASVVITVFLPLALAIIMFGLGLSLTVADFVRVAKAPRAAFLALACQMVLLPVLCLGLVILFRLDPPLAVGMMLLAASPGGTTANLFSHLAGGDVALNVSLTAVNSVLAVVTLPIVVNLSIAYFLGDGADVGLHLDKMLQVFAIVLIPVVIGMAVHRRWPAFTERTRGAVKVASVVVLALVIAVALGQEYRTLLEHLATVGVVALLLSVASLTIGYWVPRLARVSRPQAIASSMEIGVHNATLAITVALSVLGNREMAIPPAVYGILMFVPAGVCCYLLARRRVAVEAPA